MSHVRAFRRSAVGLVFEKNGRTLFGGALDSGSNRKTRSSQTLETCHVPQALGAATFADHIDGTTPFLPTMATFAAIFPPASLPGTKIRLPGARAENATPRPRERVQRRNGKRRKSQSCARPGRLEGRGHECLPDRFRRMPRHTGSYAAAPVETVNLPQAKRLQAGRFIRLRRLHRHAVRRPSGKTGSRRFRGRLCGSMKDDTPRL